MKPPTTTTHDGVVFNDQFMPQVEAEAKMRAIETAGTATPWYIGMTVEEWLGDEILNEYVQESCEKAMRSPDRKLMVREPISADRWTPDDDRWRTNQNSAVRLWFDRNHPTAPGSLTVNTWQRPGHRGGTVRLTFIVYRPKSDNQQGHGQ